MERHRVTQLEVTAVLPRIFLEWSQALRGKNHISFARSVKATGTHWKCENTTKWKDWWSPIGWTMAVSTISKKNTFYSQAWKHLEDFFCFKKIKSSCLKQKNGGQWEMNMAPPTKHGEATSSAPSSPKTRGLIYRLGKWLPKNLIAAESRSGHNWLICAPPSLLLYTAALGKHPFCLKTAKWMSYRCRTGD